MVLPRCWAGRLQRLAERLPAMVVDGVIARPRLTNGPAKLAKRPKLCLLATRPELRAVVASKLSLEWSPEQISGWLRVEYPNDESMPVSAETIYRTLFIQARGVLKKQLLAICGLSDTCATPRHLPGSQVHAAR